jgi:hypothetical protein
VPYIKEKKVNECVEYADGLKEKIDKKRLIKLETVDGYEIYSDDQNGCMK